MNKKYFKLNPECYLVLGKKRAIIHNIINCKMIWLDEENKNKLIIAESNKPINPSDDIFIELVKKGWGFFSSKPVFVDKLRSLNNFNQKKLWKDTQNINFASIQVTNDCNLNCTFCQNSFCPTCKTFAKCSPNEQLSLQQFKDLLDELSFFGATGVLFTGGEPALYEHTSELAKYALNKGLATNVHTNGLIKINKLPEKTNIIITLFDYRHLNKIVENYNKNPNVTMIVEESNLKLINNNICNGWKVIKTHKIGEKRKITKNSLLKVGLEKYFSKKLSDTCLNGKISIAYNGDVYPCFCSNNSIVNLKKSNLSKAVKILINEYWKKSIENVEDITKCSQCEYRYACNTCKFVDVDKLCTYDMEIGKWT